MAHSALTFELKLDGAELKDQDLREVTVHEAISQPFEMDMVLHCKIADSTPNKWLGKKLGFKIKFDHVSRSWEGYIAGAAIIETEGQYVVYRLHIVPKIWFLSRASHCRVFENVTALDIVKKVLDEAGYTPQVPSGGSQRPWCVQYRETDLNFVSRLLEAEGISYYFEPGKSATGIVLTNAGFHTFPGGASLQYNNTIHEWTEQRAATSSSYSIHEYAFTEGGSSAQVLGSALSTPAPTHDLDQQEMVDSHVDGEFAASTQAVVGVAVKTRLQELQTQRCRRHGTTDEPCIGAGYLFDLTDHPVSDLNGTHLVVSATHQIDADVQYQVRFEAVPAELPFRPARVTPRPSIHGLQIGAVSDNKAAGNPSDHKGPMVRVKFRWNTEKNNSCWVRVAHSQASNGFGTMFLPKVGDEVVVSFIDGDPDRPLVVGSIYTGDNKPFYDQEKALKQSGLRTEGKNELTFTDKDGSELVYVEAKKDLEAKVTENEKRTCKKFLLEAEDEITFKTKDGKAKIVMKQGGDITIDCKNLTIKAGDGGSIKMESEMGSISMKASAADVKIEALNTSSKASVAAKLEGTTVDVKASAKGSVDGGAMLTVKGAMTMIN